MNNQDALFQQATREKFRYPSVRGELNTEQLWDLSLQAKNGFDLDSVAKAINSELKASTEESFVTTSSPKNTELAAKLDVVKAIIAIRMAENTAKSEVARRKEEIRKLEVLLEKKQDEALSSLSADEITAKLAALRG